MIEAPRGPGRTWSSAATLILAAAVSDATAATKPPSTAPAASSPIEIMPGTSSKEPVSIDADKLVYYDKERKAVYSGKVVVIQGETKMTCSIMTVFLDRTPAAGANAPAAGANAPAAATTAPAAAGDNLSANSGIKHMDATGPVTVISKTQVATGDNATYDKLQDRVQLIGHVTLSDGQNTTKGDKLTYDLKTGQATIDTGSTTGRVHGQFVPNGGADPTKPK
jgi:lipopolysaccharide export system protein LptA